MRKITYNSFIVDQIYPILMLIFAFRPPIHVPNFSQIDVLIRENRYFVVPAIYSLLLCTPHFVGLHDTFTCVLICLN